MWAQAYEQQAQSDTNKPPFTKEAQAEISALATEVEKLQIELSGEEMQLANGKHEKKGGGKAADHAVKEFEALKKLMRIRELLPKDGELPPGVVRVNGTFHGAIMGETVVACIFAHARGLYAAADFQRRGVLWPRVEMTPFCSLVAGTKAVVLGYGHVGRAIGAKLEALGVEVKGISRRNIGELKGSLRAADWLVMALPGDTGTDDIIDAAALRCMKRTAVIVNVGRGNAIEEKALASALKARRIAGAYLDVFKKEPLCCDSPLSKNLPGLVRLPHASAFAPEYLPMFFREMAEAGWLK